MNIADVSQTAREPKRRKLSPASLLVSGDLSRSAEQPSKVAQRATVASQQGQGVVVRRTDIAEVWVPLQGAGSDARLLIRLQGTHSHYLWTSQSRNGSRDAEPASNLSGT